MTRAGSSSSPTRCPSARGLRAAIRRLAEPVTEDVLLICAVVPPAAGQAGVDAGRPLGPSEELEAALDELRAAGINARGSLAVSDPLRALEDALRGFEADEVVLSIRTAAARPKAGADAVAPLAPDIAEAARSLFGGPVSVVVDDDPRQARRRGPATCLAGYLPATLET